VHSRTAPSHLKLREGLQRFPAEHSTRCIRCRSRRCILARLASHPRFSPQSRSHRTATSTRCLTNIVTFAMQASLRFNLDTQFSINGEPRTSVAWFNTIRVGVWLIVLAVSFAVTFNARYLYGDRDITLGLGCTSSLVSAVLFVAIAVLMRPLLIHLGIGCLSMSSNIRHPRPAGSSSRWQESWLSPGPP
jgi:hypothetical protein